MPWKPSPETIKAISTRPPSTLRPTWNPCPPSAPKTEPERYAFHREYTLEELRSFRWGGAAEVNEPKLSWHARFVGIAICTGGASAWTALELAKAGAPFVVIVCATFVVFRFVPRLMEPLQ